MKNYLKGLLAILGGILYRLGGAEKLGDIWDSFRDTLVRDIGIGICIIFMLYPSNFWGLFFSVGLIFGVSTLGYGGEGEPIQDQSHLYKIFGKFVFFAVGFLFGLALFPYAIAEYLSGNHKVVLLFIYRIGLLTFLIPFVHTYRGRILSWDEAQVEEWCRGFVIVLSCILF